MRFEPRLDPPERPRPLSARIGCMLLYWAGGVALTATVALILRFWLS